VQSITNEPGGCAQLQRHHPTAEPVLVKLSGSWRLQDEFPSPADLEQSLKGIPGVQRMTFVTIRPTAWDSGLVTYLLELMGYGARHQIVVDQARLPEGVKRLWTLALVIVGGLLLGLEACTSTPLRFYLLNSPVTSETMAAAAAPQGPVIGVGPITMPKYLDRLQIVTRTGDNQLALSEFDRWAEPLQDNVARVLAENLARLIPTDQVLLQAWPRSAALDYQVTVEVLQFDGWLGGESKLVAFWSILDGAELSLWSQRAALHAPVSGREYEALVVAMSRLIESFSHDLAGAIQHLASRVVARE
jgi:uncharacterized lipoprotein YmbA